MRINVSMSEKLVNVCDVLASHYGISRSAFITMCIWEYLINEVLVLDED